MLHLALLTGMLAVPAAPPVQSWERTVIPGMTFRMDVQEDLPRTIYGLTIQRGAPIWTESHMANGEVYDARPEKGRGFVSQMVEESGAIGGVNGDFFQWTPDPGGHPRGMHVRAEELMTLPDEDEQFGWGPGGVVVGKAAFTASARLNGQELKIGGLNQRVEPGQLVLLTDEAGLPYSREPMTCILVRVGPYRLEPVDHLAGTVVSVAEKQSRIGVPPGHMILAASGDMLNGMAKPGDVVEVDVEVTGFDWSTVDNVMGGGPVLLREGANVVDRPDDVRHPRTSVGERANGDLVFMVVDGRQSMSVGATLSELADIMKEWGCVTAFNLDGGGSSTMNALGLTLNRPSSGGERPVANAVLFRGYPELGPARTVEFGLPSAVKVGSEFQPQITVDGQRWRVDDPRIIWACQGAGWVDQGGTVKIHAAGKGTLSAMIGGRTYRVEFEAAE